MIRTWHPISIPTRIVVDRDRTDGTVEYSRYSVIAFSIDDAGILTYMTCSGLDYSNKPRQFAFAEQLQNGEWKS